MAETLPRLRAATAPLAPADTLADLVEFHTAHPCVTEETLGTCVTGSGHTGYDILVDQLRPEDRVVLDFGAGNGPLVRRLLAVPGVERIHAVDACAAELARVPDDPRVEKHAAVPPLRGAVDAVLSHHALYLVRPPEPILAALEVAVRPGGIVAWTTTSIRAGQHPIYVELMVRLNALVSEACPGFSGWGDRRQWTPAGRASLFPAPAWSDVVEKDFVLLVHEPPEQVYARLAGFYYSAWLVDPDRLRAAWMPLLRPGPDGCVDFEWPWAVAIATRADTPAAGDSDEGAGSPPGAVSPPGAADA